MTGGDDDHDHRESSEPRFRNRRARPQILRRTTKQGSRYRYDPDRIVKALSLDRKQRYEEIGGVEGYTVFTFPYASSVLLECPIVGNAIYVIHKDWKHHRGDWFEQVEEELGTSRPRKRDAGLGRGSSQERARRLPKKTPGFTLVPLEDFGYEPTLSVAEHF
jgi:hypothetical protein